MDFWQQTYSQNFPKQFHTTIFSTMNSSIINMQHLTFLFATTKQLFRQSVNKYTIIMYLLFHSINTTKVDNKYPWIFFFNFDNKEHQRIIFWSHLIIHQEICCAPLFTHAKFLLALMITCVIIFFWFLTFSNNYNVQFQASTTNTPLS